MQIKQLVSDMRQALRLFGVNQWRCFEHGQTKIVVAWSWKAVLVCVRGSWKPGNFRADADVRTCCSSTSVPDLQQKKIHRFSLPCFVGWPIG